jgi:signal transduction histidine kinase
MRFFSSLRGRIFLTSALLAVLSIGAALYVVNRRVTKAGEAALQRDIVATGTLVDQLRTTRTDMFMKMARLIADTPKLKAAVYETDSATVLGVARGFQDSIDSNLLVVTDKSGGVLAAVGTSERNAVIVAGQPAVRAALASHESVSLLPQPAGMLQIVTVPIPLGTRNPEILGTLSVGFTLDDALAAQLKTITGSDIAFGMDGQILATTLSRSDRPALSELLRQAGITRDVHIAADDYVALPRPLVPQADDVPAGTGPVVLILRSRTEQLRPLQAIHRALAVTAVVAVLLATLLSFAVARSITRPLAAITDVMREVAATGDLTRKIALGPSRRWDDEDARLLATTFNTLTDSIARFQREISQKERLTSLGRLSTVIAHEVRNPLMIIKASLHTLRQPEADAPAVREAIADIDDEVARLNRVVNEVLDFARPIRFERAPTDLNALCDESATASEAGAPGSKIRLDLDRSLPLVSIDAERLRVALVNMLVNARHAVNGKPAADGPLVTLATRHRGGRVAIVIEDKGVGINSGDLPRVFDPYFTTKRGGTGLGLPIAKNIVEGLGGTITVSSMAGAGTEIRLEFPASAADQTGPAEGGAEHAALPR